tara:strand:+ start:670 stop:1092 length:423 start_codon:yes stop_codon:yes gene_type:complete
MSVSILIISHGDIGSSLIDAAEQMIEHNTLKITSLDANIALDANIESSLDELYKKSSSLVKELDQGDGVLILTDLFGSTPSNIAHHLSEKNNISVVAGINLSMLIRVLNDPHLNLDEMTKQAHRGGVDGIKINGELCSEK